jgi:hypothetical protein
MKVDTLRPTALVLGLVLAAHGLATAGELTVDPNTLLLLHFNNTMTGASGEVPTQSVGVTYEAGVFGNGAFLSTGDQVYYAVANNIQASQGTIEFWIKPRWNGNDGLSHSVVRYGGAGGLLVEKDGGNFWKIILNRFGSEVVSGLGVGGWIANQWHHSALTWNNSSVKVYVDGALVSETVPGAPLPSIPDATFQIGADGTGSYVDAVFDEFRISNRERTEFEVLDSFLAGLTVSSLTIQPETMHVFENWSVPVKLIAQTNVGTVTLPLIAASWESLHPEVASYDGGDRLAAHISGYTTLKAEFQGVEAYVNVVVSAPLIPPVFEPVPSFLATPAEFARNEIPVLVIRYLPTSDGINLNVSVDPDFWSLNPITLNALKGNIDAFLNRSKFALEEGSKFRAYKQFAVPSIGYRVVDIITAYEPCPPGPVMRMVADPDGDPTEYPVYAPDFHAIFQRFSVDDYVNNQGVKEVWFWHGGLDPTYPSYDPLIHDPINFRSGWESNMASALTGDISNSNRDPNDLPLYNETYTVYGCNFRRSQAEVIHNHGHQIEQLFSHVNQLQDGNTNLFWRKFVGQDLNGNFVAGRCGWTHMPPNTIAHYDYCNGTTVMSDIEDWTPDGSGETKPVNCSTWSSLVFQWPNGEVDFPQRTETQFYIYWMQSIPGHANTIPYGSDVMTNWWSFIANWEESITSGMGLYGPPATAIGDNPPPGARTVLYGAHPNPFNPTTTITYEVAKTGHITLAVYDVSGRLVKTLVSGVRQQDVVHSVTWDGSDIAGEAVASGVYFLRLVAGHATESKKIVLLK